jgi:hypothetical protein
MTKKALKYLIPLLCIALNQKLMAQPLYFSSPQESVELTAQLLIQEDWGTLLKYYYVENSTRETIDSLKDGSYFIRNKKPEVVHPAVSWKYKKPFDPNFKYSGHIEEDHARVRVDVSMEIDQGNGMIQQGTSSFYLIKSQNGYQLML